MALEGANTSPEPCEAACCAHDAPCCGGSRFADLAGLIQIELGTACGKLFRCSTMAILDAGDSDILSAHTPA